MTENNDEPPVHAKRQLLECDKIINTGFIGCTAKQLRLVVYMRALLQRRISPCHQKFQIDKSGAANHGDETGI